MSLVAAPVLLPLLTAIALAVLDGRPAFQQRLALGSGIVLFAITGALAVTVTGGAIPALALGGWGSVVGIVWAVDGLTAMMLLATAIVSLAFLLYAPGGLEREEVRWLYPLHQFLLVGVNGSFVTADLFNLFVFFEVMLLASFALISLGGRPLQLRRTFPYVVINLVGSALFLAGVGVIYGTLGTVNFAEVAVRLVEHGAPPGFPAGAALVLVVFALKAALVPLFFWLPDAYPMAPLPVAGFFGGLLTKVGVYALFRLVPIFTNGEHGPVQDLLLVVAAATMLFGVLGALGRNSIRGILSFHVVSQVGYMVFGLALFTPLGVAAGLFFLGHQVVVKTAVFFAGGVAERLHGTGELGQASGLARSHPWSAVGFFVAAMALAGLPPTSGFFGKLFLIVGGLQAEAWVATGIAIVVSLLTLASMLKIWVAVFWGPVTGENRPVARRNPGLLAATLALGAIAVVIGLLAGPLFAWTEHAALQLLELEPYVTAVRGAGGEP